MPKIVQIFAGWFEKNRMPAHAGVLVGSLLSGGMSVGRQPRHRACSALRVLVSKVRLLRKGGNQRSQTGRALRKRIQVGLDADRERRHRVHEAPRHDERRLLVAVVPGGNQRGDGARARRDLGPENE